MNKTININLGGFFFHIDEIAYQKLRRYLDAISKSLSDDPQGKNEIISDIEARISELLSERIKDSRQVVNEGDIEEIIGIMGQPEDYAEAEEGYIEDNTPYYQRKKGNSKKLFRDGDDKFLGGVAAGFGHYLGIDTIWVRLAFLILGFGAGFGIPVYIVLWILLPEAQTTSEKLQMEGEPVNIDNIEKKIRDEFNFVSEKLKVGAGELSDKISNADFRKHSTKAKSGFQDFLDTIGKLLLAVFKVFGKFIGILLMFVAAMVLLSIIVGGFSMGSFEILGLSNDFVNYPPFFYDSLLPKWLLSIFMFIAIGIPFFILFMLGLRILSSSVKKLTKATSLSLLGFWIISILGLTFSAIEYGSGRAYDGIKIEKKDLSITKNDTLKIKVINDDNLFYQHNLKRSRSHEVVVIDGEEKVYSTNVRLKIKESDTDNAYTVIKKESEGRNRISANNNAENVEYKYTVKGKEIILDAYYISNYANMHKNESVTITLFIPKGTNIFLSKSTKYFISDIENTEDIYDRDMANQHFLMTSKGFSCTDCKTEEEENEDKDKNTVNIKNKDLKIKANKNGVTIDLKAN